MNLFKKESKPEYSLQAFPPNHRIDDLADFVNQKLGGFLDYAKESLDRCECLSKPAYLSNNLYTLLVFWMTKFMEFFATVVFEELSGALQLSQPPNNALAENKPKKKSKFGFKFFNKSKAAPPVRVGAFLSPLWLEVIQSLHLLVFRFDAKVMKFSEKIRASNYFAECDQIRTKVSGMLVNKVDMLSNLFFQSLLRAFDVQISDLERLKSSKKPRVYALILDYASGYYREIYRLVNVEIIRGLKKVSFLEVQKYVQGLFQNLAVKLLPKVNKFKTNKLVIQ